MEQYIIVGAIVVVCAVYLIRKIVNKTKQQGQSACGGCNRCGGSRGGCH